MNSLKAGTSEEKAKAIGLASMAAVLLALAAFSLYDHAVMRRNFRDLYTLILKQSTASGAKADSATPTRPPAAVETAGLPRLGSDSAPLEMVLVSDFECPFCDAVGSKAIAALRKKFVDRGLLRIYYLSMPLASHKKGQEAALAAFAAHAQGRFWEMYDELFSGAPLETEL